VSFFIYALEELSAYHDNGCDRNVASAFADSEIISIRFIHRNWNRFDFFEHSVLAILDTGG